MHRIQKIMVLAVVVMTAVAARAQQVPIFTNYYDSYAVINPGFYGMSEGVNAMGIYRNQWTGFKDDFTGEVVSPRTFLASADMPIKILRGGVGLSFMKDQLGFEDNIALNLGYSYHMDLGPGTLGIGVALSLDNRKVDFKKANPLDDDDPVIPTTEQSDMLVDMNFGLFYSVPETFYVAVSTTSLLEKKGKALQGKSSTSASFVGDRTFYLAAGYEYQFLNPKFMLNSSMMVLSDIASTQINVGARFWYNKMVCFGVNYRYQESVDLLVGFVIKGIQINYAYDINTMGLKLPGSHEVSLSYNFKLDLDKQPRIYRSIRYL
ncbi:MAG: PorP/SprF family type IX secretion system membrane protein [Bacteroidales bacterium]|nr:PorP/SprF family type IX secretion system membrane protein [Bacteroidales bacterium]